MNALVNSSAFGQLPAAFQGMSTARGGINDEFGAGIVTGYPVISIKGKNWRVKARGEETIIRNPESGEPVFSLDLVIVRAAATTSKTYYPGGYTSGSSEKPACWSSDAIRPDPAVPAEQRVHHVCATCPMNKFGSKITDSGKEAKACGDFKRVAVVPAGNFDAFGGPALLRIPASSLGPFADYAGRMSRNGYPIPAIITKVSFDPQAEYPRLVFREVRPLDNAQAAEILELREDSRVMRILNEQQGEDIPAAPAPEVNWEQPEAAAQVAPQPTTSQKAAAAVQRPAQATAAPAPAKPAPAAPPAPAPTQAIQEAEFSEVVANANDAGDETGEGAPADFTSELDALLGRAI